MQINISSRHGHLSTSTQERITQKVEKLTRFFDRISSVQVTVDLEHEDSPEVEVQVAAEHSQDFIAADSAANVSMALDSVIHKIEKQIKKHKDKVTGHRATSLKHLEPLLEPEPDAE